MVGSLNRGRLDLEISHMEEQLRLEIGINLTLKLAYLKAFVTNHIVPLEMIFGKRPVNVEIKEVFLQKCGEFFDTELLRFTDEVVAECSQRQNRLPVDLNRTIIEESHPVWKLLEIEFKRIVLKVEWLIATCREINLELNLDLVM